MLSYYEILDPSKQPRRLEVVLGKMLQKGLLPVLVAIFSLESASSPRITR